MVTQNVSVHHVLEGVMLLYARGWRLVCMLTEQELSARSHLQAASTKMFVIMKQSRFVNSCSYILYVVFSLLTIRTYFLVCLYILVVI